MHNTLSYWLHNCLYIRRTHNGVTFHCMPEMKRKVIFPFRHSAVKSSIPPVQDQLCPYVVLRCTPLSYLVVVFYSMNPVLY